MAVVLNHSRARGTAKLVLLGIANHDGDGGSYPSVERLAVYAGVAERNVQKALNQLVSSGELVIEVQQGGDRETPAGRRTNRYLLRVACPPWCDHSTQHRDTRKLAGRQLTLRGVTNATPLFRSRGDGRDTPTPDGRDTLTTLVTQPPSSVPQPQDAREAASSAPCLECGKGEYDCQRQQVRWADDERHAYRPLAVRHAKG